MAKKKTLLALASVPKPAFKEAPFVLTHAENEYFAVEQCSRRMLESDWDDDIDGPELAEAYKLSNQQTATVIREARRNSRRAICRPQAAHLLIASTLSRVIEESMRQGDLRGAADAAYKLSQATGTQASIKLKVLEQQQRMDHLRTKFLTGQSTVEEIASHIIDDLMGGDEKTH